MSDLTLDDAGLEDAGSYSCQLPGPGRELGNSTVTVHILNTTNTEHLQGLATLTTTNTLLLSVIICDIILTNL